MGKRRNKKYNPVKHMTLESKRMLKDLAVVFVQDKNCYLVDLTNNLVFPANKQLVNAISDFVYNWSIHISVLGNVSGDNYIKTESIFASAPYYHCDLAALAARKHTALRDTVPSSQYVNVAWVASPEGRDISEEQLFNIYEIMNAWGE